MYEITRQFVEELGMPLIVEDAPPRHNLWMNCEKARKFGVDFSPVGDALRRCVKENEILRAATARLY
jgi:dTDP-4-dehydrorhamnose reductase